MTLFQTRMTPPPTQTLSEWADSSRILSAEASAEPGRWKTSRAEFQRGIMDSLADDRVARVVCMKAAQVGWTEIINNAVGYYIDRDPASILVMQPTQGMGETWSKKRLAPMLRDTPCINGKVRDPKSRDSDNTILEKGFPGGYLTIVGANAPSGLASRPIRVVLADEVDRYPLSAGSEGDPLTLAMKRQTTFWNRKTLVGSTPVDVATSVVNREWLASDMRRYHVPCPDCSAMQVLRWGQVVWDKGEAGHRPETAMYSCAECGSLWTDAQRWRAINKGQWVAEKPFAGIAGFHVPGFLSPWLTLREIVEDFLASKDWPMKLKTWVNTVLGEPWEERGEAADADSLRSRSEVYDDDLIPEAVKVITAGVDTQDDRLEVTFTGWGAGEEAWVLRHYVLTGDIGGAKIWNEELDPLLRRSFVTEGGRRILVRATCIDTGGHFGASVHAFCRSRSGRKIYATKGVGNDHRGSKPIWGNTLLRAKNATDRLWAVGVDTAKDDLAARLRIIPDENGTAKAIHFPSSGLSSDYFEQLTAEQAVIEINREGRKTRRWKKKDEKARNEALDCFILSHAAMLSLPIKLSKAPRYTAVPALSENGAEPEQEPQEIAPERVVVAQQSMASRPVRAQRGRWGAYR